MPSLSWLPRLQTVLLLELLQKLIDIWQDLLERWKNQPEANYKLSNITYIRLTNLQVSTSWCFTWIKRLYYLVRYLVRLMTINIVWEIDVRIS